MKEVWSKKFGSESIAIAKDSPYSIFMKQIIYKILENGQFHQIKQNWYRKEDLVNCNPIIKKGKPLRLEKLMSLFIIMIFGIIIALGTLIVERIFHKKPSPKTEDNPKKDIMKLKALLSELEEVMIRRNIDNPFSICFQSIIQDIRIKIANPCSKL